MTRVEVIDCDGGLMMLLSVDTEAGPMHHGVSHVGQSYLGSELSVYPPGVRASCGEALRFWCVEKAAHHDAFGATIDWEELDKSFGLSGSREMAEQSREAE